MWEAEYSRCILSGCTLAPIVTWLPNPGGFVTTCHKTGMVCVTVFHLSALYGRLWGHYTCYRGHRHVRHIQDHSRHAQRGSTPRHGHVINTVT